MLAFELLIVVFLVLLNGFFAMSELAVVSSRRARLQTMADAGDKGAAAALALLEEPTQFLSSVQIGITLVGVLAGAYSGATLAEPLAAWLAGLEAISDRYAYPIAIALVVASITYLSLIIGELVPKRIALNNAEGIAAFVARPMRVVATVGAPLVWLLRISTEAVLQLMRVPTSSGNVVTEEEVKSMIAEGTASGVFEEAERDMIDGVLRLADRSVRSVMTPRLEVIWLDPQDDIEAMRTEIIDSGHSRFPVARGTLDEFEGVVQAKDLLDQLMQTGAIDVTGSLRQPLVVHDKTPVLKLLDMFRGLSVHMAIVVDEYGSVEGVVTPTDILIAIAGDLPEGDEEAEEEAVQRADGSWLMDGMMAVDDAARLLGRADMRADSDYNTLAGFVLARMEHLPVAGESVDWGGLRFEVMDMDGRRIDKVLVSPVPPEQSAGLAINLS